MFKNVLNMNNCSFSLFLNILIFLIVLNTGFGVFLVAQLVTNLPAMQEAWVQSLGWEDPLEKGMATHSNILAWRIPWTVFPWVHKELDTTEQISLSLPGFSKSIMTKFIGENLIFDH